MLATKTQSPRCLSLSSPREIYHGVKGHGRITKELDHPDSQQQKKPTGFALQKPPRRPLAELWP